MQLRHGKELIIRSFDKVLGLQKAILSREARSRTASKKMSGPARSVDDFAGMATLGRITPRAMGVRDKNERADERSVKTASREDLHELQHDSPDP